MRAEAVSLGLAGTLALSACETTVTHPCLESYGPVGIIHTKATAADAADLFSEACLDTLPDFDAAEERFAAAGLTGRSSTGMRFSECRAMSGRVARGDAVTTCSIVFEDPDAATAITALEAAVCARFPETQRKTRAGAVLFTAAAGGVPVGINYSPGQTGAGRLPSFGVSVPSRFRGN